MTQPITYRSRAGLLAPAEGVELLATRTDSCAEFMSRFALPRIAR